MTDPADWIIDENGLYVATRSFLTRRGYCCVNQCRNCPYINWRNSPTWEPLPVEAVQITKVSSKAIEGARKALRYHEAQLQNGSQTSKRLHQSMIAHYRLLLQQWSEPEEDEQCTGFLAQSAHLADCLSQGSACYPVPLQNSHASTDNCIVPRLLFTPFHFS